MAERRTIIDGGAREWVAINDGVMGGISLGRMSEEDGVLVFSGELSLENNGGFASARRLVEADLAQAERVRVTYRGDGRQYQFRLRLDRGFDGVAWRAVLPAASDEWQTVELALADFVPVWRGRRVAGAGPVRPERIRQIGFMLADGQPGAFRLEIRLVEFLSPGPADSA